MYKRQAVRRYKSMLSSALARCFPRTTAYLQAEREAREALLQPAKARSRKNAAKAPAKAAGKPAKGAGKPAAASRGAPQGIYPAAALKVDESQERAMREQVAQAATLGVVSPPSEEQLSLIHISSPTPRSPISCNACSPKPKPAHRATVPPSPTSRRPN